MQSPSCGLLRHGLRCLALSLGLLFIPLPPLGLRHTALLSAPWTWEALSCILAFSGALPSSWNVFPLRFHIASHLSCLRSNVTSLGKPSLTRCLIWGRAICHFLCTTLLISFLPPSVAIWIVYLLVYFFCLLLGHKLHGDSLLWTVSAPRRCSITICWMQEGKAIVNQSRPVPRGSSPTWDAIF